LPKFTVIGATTRTGALTAPLRDRFGIIHRLEFYSTDEISKIIERAAKILESKISHEAANLLSLRARLTPRIANRLLKRVRDYADVNGDGIIDVDTAEKALNLLEVDELGLDPGDRNLLVSIIDNYGNNPVGLNTISALTGDEATTIEDFYEPYLLQIGFIERTPRGRRVTAKAFKHVGKKQQANAGQQKLV
jgi:Holliday junction DNA helicase RuvB